MYKKIIFSVLYIIIAQHVWAFQSLNFANTPEIAQHQKAAQNFLLSSPVQFDSVESHLFSCDKLHRKNLDGLEATYWLFMAFYHEKEDWRNAQIYANKYLSSAKNQPAYTCHAHHILGDILHEQNKFYEAANQYQSALQQIYTEPLDTNKKALPEIKKLRSCPQALDIITKRSLCLEALHLLSETERYEHWLFGMQLVEKCFEYNHFKADFLQKECLLGACLDADKMEAQGKAQWIYANAFRVALLRYQQSQDPIYWEDAFLILERYHNFNARLYLDAGQFFNISDSLLIQRKKLEIARQNGDKSAENQLFELEKNLSQKHPDYLRWLELSKVASIKEVQQALPNDSTAYLAYTHLSSSDTLTIFIIQKNKIQVEQKALLKTEKADAYSLFEAYFPQKIEAKIRHLVVMSELDWQIPMAAWLTANIPQSSNPAYRQMPYLLRRFSIAQQLSATLWLQQQSQRNLFINYQMLGVGASNQNSDIDSVSASLQLLSLANNYRGYFPETASTTDWQAYLGEYGFLHIAAPLLASGLSLQLSDENWATNELTWGCLKAAILAFDGVYIADSSQKIVLDKQALYRWSSSGAAALLSPNFYNKNAVPSRIVAHFYELLQSGLPKDEALRQAQLFHLETAPDFATNPEIWAGYQVWGDTIPVSIARPSSRIWWYLLPILFMAGIGWWTLRGLRQRRRF